MSLSSFSKIRNGNKRHFAIDYGALSPIAQWHSDHTWKELDLDWPCERGTNIRSSHIDHHFAISLSKSNQESLHLGASMKNMQENVKKHKHTHSR